MITPITSQSAPSGQAHEADLWPEATTANAYEPKELPVDILLAQARYLAPRTEYLLKGFVRSSNLQSGVIYHSFYIYAPYVQEEPFKPFYMKHGINLAGGITLVWGDMGPLTNQEFGSAHSLEELRTKIKDLLANENMLHLIGNLTALSKKAKAEGDAPVTQNVDGYAD